jgi:hypothetical protein
MLDHGAATARSIFFWYAGGLEKKSDPAMRPEQRRSQTHDALAELLQQTGDEARLVAGAE